MGRALKRGVGLCTFKGTTYLEVWRGNGDTYGFKETEEKEEPDFSMLLGEHIFKIKLKQAKRSFKIFASPWFCGGDLFVKIFMAKYFMMEGIPFWWGKGDFYTELAMFVRYTK